jgi:nicotinamidase-related amidase
MPEHLIVMDMQEKFLADKPDDSLQRAIATINSMINDFRARGLKITFTELDPQRYGPTIQQLQADPSNTIIKDDSDLFSADAFLARLENTDTLVFTGCNLEFCIALSVESAIAKNLNVVVVHNAVLFIIKS